VKYWDIDWDLLMLGYEYQSGSKGRGHSAVFKWTGYNKTAALSFVLSTMIYYNKLNVPFDYKNPSCEKGHFINLSLILILYFLLP